MPFPISAKGSFYLETVGAPQLYLDSVQASILDWLIRKHARAYLATDGRIFFVAGIFRFVIGWNILVPIGSGEIQIAVDDQSIRVSFGFRYVEYLAIVTITIFGLYGFALWHAPGPAKLELVGVILFNWMFFVPVGFFVSRYKVVAALKSVTRRAISDDAA